MKSIENISFAGCSWLMAYALGASKFLEENTDVRQLKFSGASSGSIVAAAMATGYGSEKTMELLLEMAQMCEERKYLKFLGACCFMSTYLGLGLDEMLKDADTDKVNGRLNISITKFPNFRNLRISEYSDAADLRQAIFASCYIPIYYQKPIFYKGGLCLDGGITDNEVISDEDTILVSAFNNVKHPLYIAPASEIDKWSFIRPNVEYLKGLFNEGKHDMSTLVKQKRIKLGD